MQKPEAFQLFTWKPAVPKIDELQVALPQSQSWKDLLHQTAFYLVTFRPCPLDLQQFSDYHALKNQLGRNQELSSLTS